MKTRGNDRGAYIADMARELAKMAVADCRPTLGYLLELAALEAEAQNNVTKFRAVSKERYEVQRS